ncbi:GNAT family N-acetyltransferase [Pedobacter gandavensis]|uniref:N-acetyltransferase n=1 Tax=Pedobacter gandavensis TaxID=2679963 RepID=A0ABR6EUW1_9SPHI|nr:GNAT family N-acetyltransferase [Pedobacter gandavensis]MBB2149035.1 N-acetyltransferase [Pedobacter gandavensis]
MNEEYVSLPLVKNLEEHRFELKVGEYVTFIEYKERDKKIWLIHTESPEELKGKGAATAVIEKTLAYIEDNGYKLIPLCPLVAAYLKRHPDWNRIVE